MVSEAQRASIGDSRVLCNLGIFGILQVCEGEQSYHKEPPCGRSLGVATGRQGAGDTTGRERFEDSASV